MFTQGRIRVIALAIADALCVAAMWAVVVCGYKALGVFLRVHGWPSCPWGGYELVEYVRFAPIALVFIGINAALDLYHGNWMYPASPQSPVEEFRRLCLSSFLTHAGAIAYMAFAYQSMDGRISRAVCVYACILTAFGSQSFRNWMRFALKWMKLGQIPVVLAGGGEAAHRFAAILDGDPYSGIRIVGYFAGTERIGRKRRRRAWNERDFQDRKIPYLGTLRDIVPQSKKRDIKMLVACQEDRLFRAQMDEFATWFTYVVYLPAVRSFPIFGARAVSFDGVGGLEMVNQGRMKVKRFQKRVMDGALALVAFVVFLPAFPDASRTPDTSAERRKADNNTETAVPAASPRNRLPPAKASPSPTAPRVSFAIRIRQINEAAAAAKCQADFIRKITSKISKTYLTTLKKYPGNLS